MPPRTGMSTCGVIVVAVERLHVAAVGRIDRVDEPREHVGRDGAPVVVAGDELHVHRSRVVGQEDRARDAATAQIPEPERAPQLDVAGEHVQRRHGIDEVTRDEQVPREIGVDAVRIEPSVGRLHGRMFGDEVQVLVELHDAPARSARRRPHVGDEESAAGQRQKVVGDARVGRLRRRAGTLGIARWRCRRRRCRSGP